MKELMAFLKGKKTYIVAGLTVVLGFLQACGIFTLPDAAWPIIAAFGLTTLRAGVQKTSEAIK